MRLSVGPAGEAWDCPLATCARSQSSTGRRALGSASANRQPMLATLNLIPALMIQLTSPGQANGF